MSKKRISEEALIVAYGLARLSKKAMSAIGCSTWNDCFKKVGHLLNEKPSSIKLLRDEFDALLPTPRRGWQNREPYESRARICEQLNDVPSETLLQMIKKILIKTTVEDQESSQIEEELAGWSSGVFNPCERLKTGRAAEEYFIQHCESILAIDSAELVDTRLEACGFDFSLRNSESAGIEVKGIKLKSGGVLFTDKEWTVAQSRGNDYILVVITNLASETPGWKVIKNPVHNLTFTPRPVEVTQILWTARV